MTTMVEIVLLSTPPPTPTPTITQIPWATPTQIPDEGPATTLNFNLDNVELSAESAVGWYNMANKDGMFDTVMLIVFILIIFMGILYVTEKVRDT